MIVNPIILLNNNWTHCTEMEKELKIVDSSGSVEGYMFVSISRLLEQNIKQATLMLRLE